MMESERGCSSGRVRRNMTSRENWKVVRVCS